MGSKRLAVGERVKIDTFLGTIVDYHDYPSGRVLLIQFDNGIAKEVSEKETKKEKKWRS